MMIINVCIICLLCSFGIRSHGPFSHLFLWGFLLYSGEEHFTFTSVQSPTGRLVVKALKLFHSVCFSIKSSLAISENPSTVSSAEQGVYPAWFLWQPWHLALSVCLCHVLHIYGEIQYAWSLLPIVSAVTEFSNGIQHQVAHVYYWSIYNKYSSSQLACCTAAHPMCQICLHTLAIHCHTLSQKTK